MEFFPNCTHPKCLRVTLVKMKNDFSGPACVLYANTKSSTLHWLRHLDRDSVLPGVWGETRDGRNILHARDYQYARNTVGTFFLGEWKRERNYCLDISETWCARNWNISTLRTKKFGKLWWNCQRRTVKWTLSNSLWQILFFANLLNRGEIMLFLSHVISENTFICLILSINSFLITS